jgi:predicted site-specific integrase-resolvase
MNSKKYSTVEVAELLDISWNTINRWILEKKFFVPPVQFVGRTKVRFWTEEEVEEVRKFKKENYRKRPNRHKLDKKGQSKKAKGKKKK